MRFPILRMASVYPFDNYSCSEGIEGGSSGGGDRASCYDLRSNKARTLKRAAGAQVLETPSSLKRAKEMEAVSMKGAHYDMRFHAPDYSIKENPESLEFEKLCREYVEIALKFFNKSKQAKKVGEYELVEVGDVSGFDRGMEGFWYHTNFKAKPKNASEAEAELFFAELNHRYPQRVKCVKCCILGPIDSAMDVKLAKSSFRNFATLRMDFTLAKKHGHSPRLHLLGPSPLLRVLALDLMLAKHSTAIASHLVFPLEVLASFVNVLPSPVSHLTSSSHGKHASLYAAGVHPSKQSISTLIPTSPTVPLLSATSLPQPPPSITTYLALNGVDEDYNILATTLSYDTNLLTFDDFRAKLIHYEQHLKILKSKDVSALHHQALVKFSSSCHGFFRWICIVQWRK
ncbi:hypothetical protein Cgig2_001949 [Carnegiea gigantea]|uniref:DUF3615 domain-containing protein n=1 Tax=Carnegiea gigantea TaxID=171969 RepID=A0A9Q1QAY2_9CARY|nr:hypothetical protein Cgig2_001949 [Carnegiea gigantea]